MNANVDTYMSPEHGWTCFHCGETFMVPAMARAHFGATPDAIPGCLMRLSKEERPLLRMVRSLEADLLRLRTSAEDGFYAEYHARLEADIRHTAPAFKNCRTLRDVFNLYDSMEGRALAAEERIAAASREGGGA